MKKVKKVFIIILCILVVIIALAGIYVYGLFNRTSNSPTLNTTDRNERWIADFQYVKNKLPIKHKNLFFSKSEIDFNNEMDLLINNVSERNDLELKGDLAKIINSINDSHTSVDIQGEFIYPISFFQFEDGIYLSNCSLGYKEYWGKKLVAVNGYSIEQLHLKLDPYVPKDNEAIAKNTFPNLLIFAEALKIAGIADRDEVVFTFEGTTKNDIKVKPLELENYQETKFLSKDTEYMDQFPLSKHNSDKYYWFYHFEEDNIIYVKYNACSNMPDYSFSDFTKDVFKYIDTNKIDKLIIDLRDNGGGNSFVFNPFFKEIKKRSSINKNGNLFVIVGRKTFSSAVLNAMDMRNKLNCTLIGEPTGGKPNHFGEVKVLHLSNTDVNLYYSSNYFKTSNIDTDSIYPDVDIALKASSYFDGKDDFLNYILDLSDTQ